MDFVIKKTLCCGCGACAEICSQKCIRMIKDEEGFLYPKIDENDCIDCVRCREVCPGLKAFSKNAKVMLGAYAAYSRNKEIREQSSSGGIFSLLAEDILSQGGIVFGAAFTNDYHAVKHILVENAEELYRLRGSKYVQSMMEGIYPQVRKQLENGRSVLFSGTPCQVRGLKGYLGKEYKKLICVDFVCMGVPSSAVWEKYLLYREAEAGARVKNVSFRNKKQGWTNYSVKMEFLNGALYESIGLKDLYMKAFLKHLCLRPSCENCWAKGINRVSDITLGDFWGIQSILPDIDDDKGISLVLVHSQMGKQIAEKILRSKAKVQEIEDVLTAIQYNTMAMQSAKAHSKRSEFFLQWKDQPFKDLVFDLLYVDTPEYRWIQENIKKLENKKIYIYGAGKVAKKFIEVFDACGMVIEAVVVTKIIDTKEKLYGYTIQEFCDTSVNGESDVVVLAVSEKIQQEIEPLLHNSGIKNILKPYQIL